MENLNRIFFAYEPIVLTATGAIIAYEQLARLNGVDHARWLVCLNDDQRLELTRESVRHAKAFAQASNRLVTVNSFPNMLRRTAEMIGDHPSLILEVNEATEMNNVLSVREDFQNTWMAIDDAETRHDFEALCKDKTQRRRLVMKTSHKHIVEFLHRPERLHRNLGSFPFLIVEGARPEHLTRLWGNGFPFAQGKYLPGEVRLESRISLAVEGDCPECDITLNLDDEHIDELLMKQLD